MIIGFITGIRVNENYENLCIIRPIPVQIPGAFQGSNEV